MPPAMYAGYFIFRFAHFAAHLLVQLYNYTPVNPKAFKKCAAKNKGPDFLATASHGINPFGKVFRDLDFDLRAPFWKRL